MKNKIRNKRAEHYFYILVITYFLAGVVAGKIPFGWVVAAVFGFFGPSFYGKLRELEAK